MPTDRRRRIAPMPVYPSSERIQVQEHEFVEDRIPFAERISCTVAEACVATGLGRTKLYELIGAGSVETVCVGRRRLVSVKSLLELIRRYTRQ